MSQKCYTIEGVTKEKGGGTAVLPAAVGRWLFPCLMATQDVVLGTLLGMSQQRRVAKGAEGKGQG